MPNTHEKPSNIAYAFFNEKGKPIGNKFYNVRALFSDKNQSLPFTNAFDSLELNEGGEYKVVSQSGESKGDEKLAYIVFEGDNFDEVVVDLRNIQQQNEGVLFLRKAVTVEL